jgi:hypothetical protein
MRKHYQRSGVSFLSSDLIAVDSDDEEQRRVSSVDAFVIAILEERALLLRARQALADDLTLQTRLLGDRKVLVVPAAGRAGENDSQTE